MVCFPDGWWNTDYCYRAVDNMTANDAAIKNHTQTIFHGHNKTTSPVEEFWEYESYFLFYNTKLLESKTNSIPDVVSCNKMKAWNLV